MTSKVKRWQQIFEVFMMFWSAVPRKSRSQYDPTGDPAAIRGFHTT
jgi:hypothetical protein